MNNENFMKDKMFFAREIAFDMSGKKISSKEIDEIDDFAGKEDFIRFYTAHNGGYFMEDWVFFSLRIVIRFLNVLIQVFVWSVFLKFLWMMWMMMT